MRASGKRCTAFCLLVLACSALLRTFPVCAEMPGPFVWKETVPVAAAGWGRMIRLADGRWLSVGTLYQSPASSTLQLKLSADQARTWAALSEVAEPGRKLDNGELIQLPNRTLLLTGRSVIDGQSFHLPVYQSVDCGAHWAYLSMIDANDAVVSSNHPSQGLWEPHFFLLPGGKLAAAYVDEKHSVETPSYSQICGEKVSADGGATWGAETTLVSQPGGGGLRPGMPVVARMRDGRYMEVSEIVGLDNAAVFFKVFSQRSPLAGGPRRSHCLAARRTLGEFFIRWARGCFLLLQSDFGQQ